MGGVEAATADDKDKLTGGSGDDVLVGSGEGDLLLGGNNVGSGPALGTLNAGPRSANGPVPGVPNVDFGGWGKGPMGVVGTVGGVIASLLGAPAAATAAAGFLGDVVDTLVGNKNVFSLSDILPSPGGRPRNVPLSERTAFKTQGSTTAETFQADFTRVEKERADEANRDFSEGGEDQFSVTEEGPPTMVSSLESPLPPVISPSTVASARERVRRNRQTRERANRATSFETLLGL